MADVAVAPTETPVGATTPDMGPLGIALQRLRHNKLALAFGAVFLLIVILCALAPVYADHVAHTGPNSQHISQVITVGGQQKNVVSLTGVPIGPTWHSKFLLGADPSGRDVAVRVLYGGRNSLEIGLLATVITMIGAVLLGVTAGFFRGWTDTIISRLLDLIWAYPALLLGVALGVSLAVGGLAIGPLHIQGGSNLLPSLVIGVVYIPYVARPLRGEVLTAAGARIRRRRPHAGLRPAAHHRQRDPSEPVLHAHRLLCPAAGAVDRARGEPVVPRRRGAAAQSVVGDHAGRRGRSGDQRAASDVGSGPHARACRAVREHLR